MLSTLKSKAVWAIALLTSALAANAVVAQPAQKVIKPRLVSNQAFLVTRVFFGYTAQQQGLERGDVIYRIDGQRIRSANDLRFALRNKFRVRATVLNVRDHYRPVSLWLYPRFGKIGIDGYSVDVDRLREPPVPFMKKAVKSPGL